MLTNVYDPAVFVSVFIVVLTIVALGALWSRHNETHGRQTGARRIVAIAARGLVLLVAIVLAGGVSSSVIHSLDSSKHVVATGAYATSSDASSQSSRPTAETAARQSQMRAVYTYLEGQGTLSNMSLSFGTDAEGAPYAVVSTGTEDIDGTPAAVEYRLYDRGEAVNSVQVVQEEFVLEKVYPAGEREAEIEGFYLVDMVSLEVTDEHKTTQ